jgi:1A family penicillin-binding protein
MKIPFLQSGRNLAGAVIFEVFFISILFVLGSVIGFTAIYQWATPNIDNIRAYQWKLPSIIYDRTGTIELYRLYDEENRIVIGHDAIPESVRLATIASEDQNFYSHRGVDPLSILRAIGANMQSGQIEQGGSTITQQLARALYLTNERTLERKVREALLAIKIDHLLSKDEILDLYLNTVPYGANAYGIESAAQLFFKKKAIDLTLEESALLAALPNAPTYFSPYRVNLEKLRSRQEHILLRMRELGYITEKEYAAAMKDDPLARIVPRKDEIVAPHFVFAVLDELRTKYSDDELRTGGLRVTTTLDLGLQKSAEDIVRDGAKKNLSRGAENAALVAIDAKNGDILAMVGSRDYFDPAIDGNVNVTIEKRQPGSAFKPFAYATAFSEGFQPETPIYDVPINFGPDGSGKNYIPQNYDGKTRGLLTMRQSLAMSLNIPAVQTLALAGVEDTIKLATDMGITTLTDPKRYGLALVLGGAEVRPLDMANAFSVFGQEGRNHPTTGIAKIIDRSGKEVAFHEPRESKQVLDPEVARKINSILSDNAARTPIFGPRSPLAFPAGVTVAAKTGTTQNFRDAWTVGYTPSIAVAVWAGNNDNRPMHAGADGVFVAAPIWRAFIDQALKQYPETGFTAYKPQTVNQKLAKIPKRTIYIDKKTGREIPESEAKKKKKDRVEKITVDSGDFKDGDVDEDLPGSIAPLTLRDVQKLYETDTAVR